MKKIGRFLVAAFVFAVIGFGLAQILSTPAQATRIHPKGYCGGCALTIEPYPGQFCALHGCLDEVCIYNCEPGGTIITDR